MDLWAEEEGAGPAVVFIHGGLGRSAGTAARRIPGARLVELDSDHYLTLRNPEQLGELLLEFLASAAPAA